MAKTNEKQVAIDDVKIYHNFFKISLKASQTSLQKTNSHAILASAGERKIVLVRDVFLGLLLLLDFTICKQVMLEGLWVK